MISSCQSTSSEEDLKENSKADEYYDDDSLTSGTVISFRNQNPHHVLYKLSPDKTDHTYNLRPFFFINCEDW